MLPNALVKNYDGRRLRNVLAALFLALVIPTAAVIWQAYGHLKWEAFYQYSAQAEALTNRIDNAIATRMANAEARSFADFAFLNVAQTGKVLQRSPLAAYPVAQDLPGVIGYFQVDAKGAFSTPLLPAAGTAYAELGLDVAEYEQRSALASEIRQILAANKLVSDRAPSMPRPTVSSAESDSLADVDAASPIESGGFRSSSGDTKDNVADRDPSANVSLSEPVERQLAADEPGYKQDVFTALNQAPMSVMEGAPAEEQSRTVAKRENSLGRVQDLGLDDVYQKKTAERDKEMPEFQKEKLQKVSSQQRGRRTEQVTILESYGFETEARSDASAGRDVAITTFASDIDPYDFSLLDSGHLVIYRKVLRNGEQYIQGLLVDQNAFSESVIANAFRETTLAGMSDLIVAYQDDIISVIPGGGERGYLNSSGALDGTLLFRRALSAPFDRLELVFSINQMPRGPGGGVLAWSTIVIAVVFLVGFVGLYRLGLSQIRLARQQQDFVSAVSHELKTPLTSIRMYGEMLKEGWADEKKQKQYYEYIHDESERLTRLISNVLQLAKISRSDPELDLQAFTVGELISQIESKITNQVERAGFELRLSNEPDANESVIQIDADCFAQIIINLVDNAIKFSRDANDKAIDITARVSTDRHVTFTVRDFGPGVPKNQMKKIFQMFYRTESELTRETVGTGIGLAIVHQLVTTMNGRVDVINREPGAQFNVSFPLG